MKPLSLTLKGFRGIRDGLGCDALELDFEKLAGGAQLVAIVGKNGRGKTTIMDNMTPFPIMPSRAGADGLGSFSYYDHICLPESTKDLMWEHGGKRYRSQMVFRVNGRKKTEAFLHEHQTDGWRPVTLHDGTVSDGKQDTYMRCVEGILGNAETFFTSAFSAQGRRQLSAYKNAEIKSLLADLLGLEKIRELGAKASETAKLLKAGLHTIRLECTGLQAEADQTVSEIDQLGDTRQRIAAMQAQKAACQSAVDTAKESLAKALANKAVTMQTEARRAQLHAERRAIIDSGKAALTRLDSQDQREAERLAQVDQRIAQRAAETAHRRKTLTAQRVKLEEIVRAGKRIEHAVRKLPVQEFITTKREARAHALRQDVEKLEKLSTDEKLLRERIASIEREAGQAVLKAQELVKRFGLTAQVPCVGTDLQGQCKLLGDAREAKGLMPSADAQIARLEEARHKLAAQLTASRAEASSLAGVHNAWQLAEAKLRHARYRTSKRALLAARQGELAQANESLASVTAQIQALPEIENGATVEEKAEHVSIAQARQQIAMQRAAESTRHRESLDRMDAALAVLPAPFDESQITQAQQTVDDAQRAAAQTDAAYMTAVGNQQRAAEAERRKASIMQRLRAIDERTAHIEKALGGWMLFAKCMSNDGLIALSIDDAGPTLAGLANDLLLACYGPRFTVSIKTQIETGKGEAHEGFDIVVHDADSGDSKSVTLMSGGERVWISCRDRHEIHYAESQVMPSVEQSEGHPPWVCPPDSGDATRHKTPSSATINSCSGKSIRLMSGGERTWIEACLIRAIALYLAHYSGRRYATLFSDEADGPLDPERKRMFIAMKREVLRIGGYKREFFITQTPALAAMADVVIDLDDMHSNTFVET